METGESSFRQRDGGPLRLLRNRPSGFLESANIVSLFSKLPAPPPEPGVPAANQPLAERMRPRTLDEFIGQEKLLGPGKPLPVQIESDNLGSMLYWGPPPRRKTTPAPPLPPLPTPQFVPLH